MQCILCDKSEYWTIGIIKIPEQVFFCLECSNKFADNNTYDWWRAAYIIWKWIQEIPDGLDNK